MYNPLLDRLPEDYQGWLIRTDYRIGVQIQLCISDPDLNDGEKTGVALGLLYGNGMPDIQTAIEGLSWFMSCGNPMPAQNSDDAEPAVYSFEYDAARIASAFRKVFHIDITREKMHWFEFIPMLGDLSDTAFCNVINIRETKLSDIDQKRRAEFSRMKKRFALPNQYSEEEQQIISDVLEKVKGKRA